MGAALGGAVAMRVNRASVRAWASCPAASSVAVDIGPVTGEEHHGRMGLGQLNPCLPGSVGGDGSGSIIRITRSSASL